MSVKRILCQFVFYLAFGISASTLAQNDAVKLNAKSEAQKAWAELVREKGGEEKLHSISSFAVFRYGIAKDPNALAMSELHVLPDKICTSGYDFSGNMYVSVIDNSRRVFRIANSKGIYKEDTNYQVPAGFGLERVIYLLETKYDRPQPVRVTRQKLKGRSFDVLEVNFEGTKIEYFYEPEEMLVRKIVVYAEKGFPIHIYEFFEYAIIDGLKMPQSELSYVARFPDNVKSQISFQFNVDYDPDIFTRINLKARTVEAWKRTL